MARSTKMVPRRFDAPERQGVTYVTEVRRTMRSRIGETLKPTSGATWCLSTRCRRNQTWLGQAFQNNPRLFLLRPTPPSTRLHHFQSIQRTDRMAVHTYSSQPSGRPPQGVAPRRLTLLGSRDKELIGSREIG